MKNLAMLFIGASLMFASCKKAIIKPSSNITSTERIVEGFNEIEVSDAIEVTITHSAGDRKVVVEANANIHSYIVTDVKNGKLKIYRKKNVFFRKDATIKVHITMPEIISIDASGASEVTFLNQIVANHIDINASGASEISGNLNATSTTIDLIGSSEIDFNGSSNLATLNLSGASEFASFSFQVNDLNADLSGASEVSITVNNNLSLKASGSSNFNYKGNCSISDLDLSGSSTIDKH